MRVRPFRLERDDVFFQKWSDDGMANCAICLAHMIDKALATTIATKDEEFVTQGVIPGVS